MTLLLFIIISNNFNPRPREEGDNYQTKLFAQLENFNPRPREEGDIANRFGILNRFYFNPRPREEGDGNMAITVEDIVPFQSTPS